MSGQLGGLAHVKTANGAMECVPSTRKRFVLKPVQSGSRGLREVSFYEFVRSRPAPRLAPFLCRYRGVYRSFIVLDDLTAGLSHPCALDVKIGTKTYEEDATPAKRRREAEKYPPQETLGCRIVGMRLYDNDEEKPIPTDYDKHWGYSLNTRDDLERGLHIFFARCTEDALVSLEQRLKSLSDWVEFVPNDFVFISSSLLFVYDALHPSFCDVRLIDFAHVRRDTDIDTGFLVGLATIRTAIGQRRQRPATY